MSNIDKQWLQQKIAEREAARDDIQFGLDEDDSNTLAALRIALASLEAGPVYFVEIEDGQDINAGRIEGKNRPDLSLLPDGINHLYAAPPAPVSVPEEVSWEDVPEEITEDDMALASAWAHGFNQCRAAMLQGAEPVTTAYKLPQPIKDHRLNSGPDADDYYAGYQAGWNDSIGEAVICNSPVIPDGWVLAPVEPTYQMCEAMGVPWESPRFPDCYKAMIAAAPDFREIVNSSTNNFRENAETSTKCWCRTCRPVTISDMRFVVCPECGNKRCPHANDHRNACTGSNEPGQEGSAYPAAPQQGVK